MSTRIGNKCCECKCVVKDETKCLKCNRPYHPQCLPNRLVRDDKSGEIIGCTICVVRARKSTKRKKIDEENDEMEVDMVEKNEQYFEEQFSNLKIFFENLLEEKTEELRKEIVLLKKEIADTKKEKVTDSENLLYSDVIKKTMNEKQKNNTLIVKPKNNANEVNIIKEIKEKVDVTNLEIGIKGMIKNKNGSVTIRCNNEKNQNCLKKEIAKKIDEVKVTDQMTAKYNLKIVGIDNDIEEKNDDEILTIIKKQNDILDSKSKIKIKKRINLNKVGWSMILDVDCVTHQQLLEQTFVYLGWQRCKIFDSANVRRCFNCWGYGHTQSTCKKDKACKICAEKHDQTQCQNDIKKCINCVNQKMKFNLKDLNVNHEATDRSCPHYLRILKKLDNAE